ncbi:hypothetical protein, partial [Pseudomonas sp. 100_A]|uniref:hypothetical protein n=1 Tax=Pseudomonas sp. 100_A TaxID=2813571 RepID=UPI001AA00795
SGMAAEKAAEAIAIVQPFERRRLTFPEHPPWQRGGIRRGDGLRLLLVQAAHERGEAMSETLEAIPCNR